MTSPIHATPLDTAAVVSLGAAFGCAAIIAVDMARRPQHMAIMVPVWPITALYLRPVGLWAYWTMGRPGPDGKQGDNAFWQQAFVGTTHCGAGCTLGDVVAEFAVFAGGLTLFGSAFGAELAGDFALAYLLGLVFQYFSIVPMRHLGQGEGIVQAAKADTLSLVAFEVGLFGWMALMRFVLFDPKLEPEQPAYWFMMQVGMAIGFATTYPVNRWLIRRGIKETM